MFHIYYVFHYFHEVVVIHEADKLSKQAQQGLRRTMEKYMNNLRLIFCCESTGKIMSPIRSRCLLIRIAAPSIEQVNANVIKETFKALAR